jgi:hypothetical protein
MHDQFGEQLTALNLRIGLLTACDDVAGLSEQVVGLEERRAASDRDVDQLSGNCSPRRSTISPQAALANYINDWWRGPTCRRNSTRPRSTIGRRRKPKRRSIASRRAHQRGQHSQAKNVEVI